MKEGRLLKEVKLFIKVKKDKDEHKDATLNNFQLMYVTLVPNPEPGCEIKPERSAQEIVDGC